MPAIEFASSVGVQREMSSLPVTTGNTPSPTKRHSSTAAIATAIERGESDAGGENWPEGAYCHRSSHQPPRRAIASRQRFAEQR